MHQINLLINGVKSSTWAMKFDQKVQITKQKLTKIKFYSILERKKQGMESQNPALPTFDRTR
jgi:hypothetical protein